MPGCRKESDGVAGITRRLLFDYYREKPWKSCPARLSRFFLKMAEICAIPTKPLPCRAFQFAGLIIPTLKAAGSNPVGRTKEDPVTTRFMFIGTQCDLWGKPDGTGHKKVSRGKFPRLIFSLIPSLFERHISIGCADLIRDITLD